MGAELRPLKNSGGERTGLVEPLGHKFVDSDVVPPGVLGTGGEFGAFIELGVGPCGCNARKVLNMFRLSATLIS